MLEKQKIQVHISLPLEADWIALSFLDDRELRVDERTQEGYETILPPRDLLYTVEKCK